MDIDACLSLDVSVVITRESVDDHGYSWIYITLMYMALQAPPQGWRWRPWLAPLRPTPPPKVRADLEETFEC